MLRAFVRRNRIARCRAASTNRATATKRSAFVKTHTMNAMIEALAASGPHPDLAEKLQLFGQFVGSWNLLVVNYRDDGSEIRLPGEWHFDWVLEGRAIQDVWISPPRGVRGSAPRGTGDYGTALRFYDAAIDAWRSTWIGPERGRVIPFIARKVGDEIVLDGAAADGLETRWIFSRVTEQSFHWRAEESLDGWQTHLLRQEMFATRRTPVPS
jgi:hypothetical protein